LYESVQLVFLLGTQIPAKTMRTVEAFVRNGGVAAAIPRLAPAAIRKQFGKGTTVIPEGRGKWVLFTDAADPALKRTLAPYLGSPDELRYRFGDTDVIFTAPKDFGELEAQVRPARR
ncbi:MAG: hypothetical protein HN380_31255, partial [Victivallales bacterium]|nr:hypothetical protein [Victivallales bacterium]